MNELNVKVGDKLLYSYGYSYNRIERIVTVTKVTPTGRIRIDFNDTQYDKCGREMGNNDIWSCKSSLSVITEADIKRIRENNVISKALKLVEKLDKKSLSYEKALQIIEILEEV